MTPLTLAMPCYLVHSSHVDLTGVIDIVSDSSVCDGCSSSSSSSSSKLLF